MAFALIRWGRAFSGRGVVVWLGLMAAALLTGCASLGPPQPLPPERARTDVADTPLAKIAAASTPGDQADAVDAAAQDLSGFQLMPEGPTALNARIALARRARKSIDAQYYVLQDDGTGLLFLHELLEAARRGVRVRLLVDDLYTAGKDDLFAALASQPNFELRLFNPLAVRRGPLAWRVALSLGDIRRINRRMHNKLFVADNSVAITGGRNIGDEYFMRSDVANFVDMDVLATGPVVPELSASFDDYWNSAQVRPIAGVAPVPPDGDGPRAFLRERLGERRAPLPERETDVLGQRPIAAQLDAGRLAQIAGDGRAVADIPEKVTLNDAGASFAGSVTERTVAMLYGARTEVAMVSPYFIPGERGLALLQDGVRRGVRIVVLTNSLDATDESLVYAGYARYRLAMLKAGIHLYELGGRLAPRDRQLGDFRGSIGRLHAKLAIVDQRRMFIGSMNLDGRSARLNTEIGLLIDSPPLAHQIARLMPVHALGAYELRLNGKGNGVEWFEHDADGHEQRVADEPGASWLGSARNWLLLQLLPEDLL